MTTVELLNELGSMDSPARQEWIRQLLTHDRTEPDCPGPEEHPAHLRLLELCNDQDPGLREGHRLVQARLFEDAATLCGRYDPQAHGTYLGLELLRFAKCTRSVSAAWKFNELLASRAFGHDEPDQRTLWREAHWTIPGLLRKWQSIQAWVMMVACGAREAGAESPLPPSIIVSAIGVWARYGLPTSFEQLVLAEFSLVPRLDPWQDRHLYSRLVRYGAELFWRTCEEPGSASHAALAREPFNQLRSRDYDSELAWDTFLTEVGDLVAEPLPVLDIRTTDQAVARVVPASAAGVLV